MLFLYARKVSLLLNRLVIINRQEVLFVTTQALSKMNKCFSWGYEKSSRLCFRVITARLTI